MLTDRPIHLIGAGGHALVVIDALIAAGVARDRLRLFDQRAEKAGTTHFGIQIEQFEPSSLAGCVFHICFGDNGARLALGEMLEESGAEPLAIVHPAATVSDNAELKAGSFVAARAVIGPFASVGSYGIVNHSAVVDHECSVGEGCHIAPGAILGGGVTVERQAMVGAGATILPRIKVGQGAVIGAGAVVIRDVGAGEVQVGVPARGLPER